MTSHVAPVFDTAVPGRLAMRRRRPSCRSSSPRSAWPAATCRRAARAPTTWNSRVTPREAASRAWAVLPAAWTAYRDTMAEPPGRGRPPGLTRERWLAVLLRELGFGRVPAHAGRRD